MKENRCCISFYLFTPYRYCAIGKNSQITTDHRKKKYYNERK